VSEDLANRTTSVVTPPGVVALESPSLFRQESNGDAGPTAYELKFLLSEEQARLVEALARHRLTPDPHADPALGGAYRTTSLYTDTPQFDVFRRVGSYGRSKLRARRYGQNGPVFLEQKDKNGDKVRKCRVSVPTPELAILTRPGAPTGWPGEWFHQRLALRRLAPVCRVTYERVAYLGTADGGAVRLTFDRNVRGEVADGWEVVPVRSAAELLPGHVICEFKYRLAMPLLFKEIVQALGLNPSPISKYRRFVALAGIAPEVAAERGGPADG
jgi:hypothetical protein